MKKQVLFIAAVLISVGGAIATKATNHKASTGTSLYWFDPSGTTYDQQTDRDQEILDSGCPDESSVDCMRGYSASQLNNQLDPSQGVKTTEVENPVDRIHDHN